MSEQVEMKVASVREFTAGSTQMKLTIRTPDGLPPSDADMQTISTTLLSFGLAFVDQKPQ